jgi:hypothetical protein
MFKNPLLVLVQTTSVGRGCAMAAELLPDGLRTAGTFLSVAKAKPEQQGK